MPRTGRRDVASPWIERPRAATARLSWTSILQASAGVAVLTVGLATAGGGAWAIMAARQAMHGHMASFVGVTFRTPAVHVGLIEVAENTP